MVSDDVVVPGLGVGTVAAVERMPVAGDPVKLYRIQFGEDTRMWIPVDRLDAEGVREPMPAE
ncbi:MAG: hypothetical protein H6739_00080, partial [Alphaproteobacteria bacterium]|nr:hypothetical protein [Alphaproteobacteria bacterium]